ncbi:MAG: hypothetical protein KU38_01385 [Sulfurovum sp. FS08-3]|nr:MAG: hypothetical protein KU38_01385 [Sulfurovum sp. FS08-3]
MEKLDRMRKECFWEYRLSDDEIRRLAKSPNEREQKFLFEKILLNSSVMFRDLKIFDTKRLEELIESYQPPICNHDYAFKRKNMAEVYFLNTPLLVDELRWIV